MVMWWLLRGFLGFSWILFPPKASGAAGQRRPAAAAPEQEAGPHGGPGPDADPHHGAALPAYVQQGISII